MTAVPQPTTEAGVQALVDEYNRERKYVGGRVAQGVVCLILGLVIAKNAAVVGIVLLAAAICLFVNSGVHARRSRDLRLQAKIAADSLGLTVQEV